MKRFAFALLFAMIPAAAFAQPDWGVFPDGGTLYFYSNTVGSDGVAETPASEAIAVYKDGSATQLTTGATIDDDFDSVVGMNQIAIDTTQSGFDAGSTYTVVYSAGTVDSVSITGRVIGSFRLGVVPANVTQLLGTAPSPHTAGYFPATIKDGTGTGELDTASGYVLSDVGKILGTACTADSDGNLVTHDSQSLASGLLTSSSGAVITITSALSSATLAPAGASVLLVDTSTGVRNYRTVVSATTTTITLDAAPTFTVVGSDFYQVFLTRNTNLTQWLGTAAATPTVAGVPEVDVTYANGSAITTTGAVDANVTQISGDSTAADNAELMFDGTGYAGGTTKLGVNTTHINSVAQATPGAAGGLFIAGTNAQTTITSGFGAGSITATSLAANTITAGVIATDAIGASELATAAADEIASAGAVLITDTIDTVTSQTAYELGDHSTGSAGTYAGQGIVIRDISTGRDCVRRVVAYADGTPSTVTVDSAPDFTVVAGDTVKIIYAPAQLETIRGKLPSKAYLTGTTNSDGDVQLNEATGALGTDTIAAASIAADAIGASELATDAIGSAEVASSVGTELAAAFLATDLNGDTWSERLQHLDGDISSASGFDSSQRAQILAALSIGEETGVPKAQTWVVKRIDGQLKATGTIPKDAEETFDVLVDFRAVLASGDAIKPADEGGIVSIELIDDGAEGDQVESDAFDDVDNASVWMNAGIRFEVSGGTIGQTDRIRVKALTVDGKTLSVPCSIKVTDAGAP